MSVTIPDWIEKATPGAKRVTPAERAEQIAHRKRSYTARLEV